MANGDVTMVTTTKHNWSLIIQLATILFLAGIAYASFETKQHAAETAEELRKFNQETYMPRELSLEKWANNDRKHEELQRTLDAILTELRRSNAAQARR